jgi:hypothetical protein
MWVEYDTDDLQRVMAIFSLCRQIVLHSLSNKTLTFLSATHRVNLLVAWNTVAMKQDFHERIFFVNPSL